MNKESLKQQLQEKISKENILFDEFMSEHTTFKIGGPADVYVTPQSIEELIHAIKVCRELGIEYLVVGKGSNLLIGDGGVRGVVIEITKGISKITVDGEYIYAEAGAMLINVAYQAYKNSLEGLEFACGIPGTIGGAVFMNAGAYKGEMKQILVDVQILTKDNEVKTLTNEELGLGYRSSCIQEDGSIVLSARMKLEKGNKEEIKEKRDKLTVHRTTGQPLDLPSAGSVFKRPEGHYSGKLIQDAELKGYKLGGAQVSEKHANFIVNSGNATAKDVMDLIKYIQEVVYKKDGVKLETEVRLTGEA